MTLKNSLHTGTKKTGWFWLVEAAQPVCKEEPEKKNAQHFRTMGLEDAQDFAMFRGPWERNPLKNTGHMLSSWLATTSAFLSDWK